MQTAMILNGRRFSARHSVPEIDVIYLGSEFCPNLLPGPVEFGRALKLFKKRVVLATPFLTDRRFGNIEAIIRKYSSEETPLEIVANDLGLIHLVRQKYAPRARVALGRILGHALRSSGDAFLEKFFAENRVFRVETDSPDLLARYERFPGLSHTYHIPYSYMGVTRFCPWERHWVEEKCRYACLGRAKKLTSSLIPRPLHLMSSGYFARGPMPPRNRGIDRIVYQPSVH